MSPRSRRQAYKRALKRINTILRQDWDPIAAGVPEDEYQSYAPPILRLLLDNADHAARMLLDLDLPSNLSSG